MKHSRNHSRVDATIISVQIYSPFSFCVCMRACPTVRESPCVGVLFIWTSFSLYSAVTSLPGVPVEDKMQMFAFVFTCIDVFLHYAESVISRRMCARAYVHKRCGVADTCAYYLSGVCTAGCCC